MHNTSLHTLDTHKHHTATIITLISFQTRNTSTTRHLWRPQSWKKWSRYTPRTPRYFMKFRAGFFCALQTATSDKFHEITDSPNARQTIYSNTRLKIGMIERIYPNNSNHKQFTLALLHECAVCDHCEGKRMLEWYLIWSIKTDVCLEI